MISQPGSQRSIWHYPTLTGATELPNRLLATTPPIGKLAPSPVKKRQEPRSNDDDATFRSKWSFLCDTRNFSPHMQLEAFRRTTALRRALREEENNGTIALSSDSPRRPSTAATNSNQPRPQKQQPAPLPASRTLDSASVHSNIRPDSDTQVLKHNESTSTKLVSKLPNSAQRYVSPPPTQVIHLPSENHVQHRVHVLIPKLQTADTTRSTKLHRPRRLRPSSNTRGMPPPLQSLRVRPRSFSPANTPNNGQQTP